MTETSIPEQIRAEAQSRYPELTIITVKEAPEILTELLAVQQVWNVRMVHMTPAGKQLYTQRVARDLDETLDWEPQPHLFEGQENWETPAQTLARLREQPPVCSLITPWGQVSLTWKPQSATLQVNSTRFEDLTHPEACQILEALELLPHSDWQECSLAHQQRERTLWLARLIEQNFTRATFASLWSTHITLEQEPEQRLSVVANDVRLEHLSLERASAFLGTLGLTWCRAWKPLDQADDPR